MRKKDLVPPLVPIFPCWSVVIAASETGVSTKTGVRDGSVLMDQRWLQWVNKLLQPESVVSVRDNLELPCSIKIVQDSNGRFETQRHDHVPHTSQWNQHRSGAGFSELGKRCRTEGTGELSAVLQDTTSAVTLRPTSTLSLARSETSWKHSRTVPRYS